MNNGANWVKCNLPMKENGLCRPNVWHFPNAFSVGNEGVKKYIGLQRTCWCEKLVFIEG